MAYIINRTDGTRLLTLQDGSLDTSTTSLGFIGQNYTYYGEVQNENFLFLLENFAHNTPPKRPIRGQTWYNTEANLLNVYSGESWISVGSAMTGDSPPDGVTGALWFNTKSNQFFVYSDNEWQLIGPLSLAGYGKTKIDAILIYDDVEIPHPAIVAYVNNEIVAIFSFDTYRISSTRPVTGFIDVYKGLNVPTNFFLQGNVKGTASSADTLSTPRKINQTLFDGSSDVTVRAPTIGQLVPGDYVKGKPFDGSILQTWSVDGSPNNIIGKVVARDADGSFSANEITANKFHGTFFGNVSVDNGLSTFDRIRCNEIESNNPFGSSLTAQRLANPRNINRVSFDGTEDITTGAKAELMFGTRLSPEVKLSSLEEVGELNSLKVKDFGVSIGNDKLQIKTNLSAEIDSNAPSGLSFYISDTQFPGNKVSISLIPSSKNSAETDRAVPALVPEFKDRVDIGTSSRPFNTVFTTLLEGEATRARYADVAEVYSADRYYEPGTVLMFGGKNEVTQSTLGSTSVVGVVSTAPAYLMNSKYKCDYPTEVALLGRVPCKVKGFIKKGDLLVSGNDGVAIASKNPRIGTVIGKAIEDFNCGTGVIEILVGSF